jgi:hypothetical protein
MRTLLACICLLTVSPAFAATDEETVAHRSVLDLAGAFANDGFKLRDGAYDAILKPGQATVIQVNLYAGNQYWFAASTADAKSTVSLSVFDENGKPVKYEPYSNPATAKEGSLDEASSGTNRVAAGFSPDSSGPYYLRIANTSDAPATCCLIYSYK